MARVLWDNQDRNHWETVTIITSPNTTSTTSVDHPGSAVDITGLLPRQTYQFTALEKVDLLLLKQKPHLN